jgi:hypothetical protein
VLLEFAIALNLPKMICYRWRTAALPQRAEWFSAFAEGETMNICHKLSCVVLAVLFVAPMGVSAEDNAAAGTSLTKKAHEEIEATALAMDPAQRLRRAAMAVEDIFNWEKDIKKLLADATAGGEEAASKAVCIKPNLQYIGVYLKTARQQYTNLKSATDDTAAAHYYVLIAAQQQGAKGYAQAAQICTGTASFGEDTKQSWWKDEDVHPVDDLVLASEPVLPPSPAAATVNPQTTTATLTPNGG